MELVWDHQVVDVLADGYDVHYGARSIKYEVGLIRTTEKFLALQLIKSLCMYLIFWSYFAKEACVVYWLSCSPSKLAWHSGYVIMKICPCNIQNFFSGVNIEIFIGKFLIFFSCTCSKH